MSSDTLKARVEHLEAKVAKLDRELRDLRTHSSKDWRRTIGAFTDDKGMQDLLREAMRLREVDRKKARSKNGRKKT